MQQLHTACVVIIVVVEVVGTMFCFGRLASRILKGRAAWRGLIMWSDICMALAWFLSVAFAIASYQVTELGHYGYHDVDAEFMPWNWPLLWKWQFAETLCYNPILGLIKASMILLYLRLGGTKNGVRAGCYVLLVVNFCHAAGSFLADLFQCSPVRYVYDRIALDLAAQAAAGATDPGVYYGVPLTTGFKDGVYVAGGSCFNIEKYLLSTASIALFTDLLILLIPVYMVYDLSLRTARKLLVVMILCLGICVTAIGAVRVYLIWKGFHHSKTDDIFYSVSSTISQMETGVALITGCVPDLFPIIRHMFPNFLRSTHRSESTNPYPYATGTGSTFSRARKAFTPLNSGNMSRSRSQHDPNFQDDDNIPLDDCVWRNDVVTTGEVQVKGGASMSSTEALTEHVQDKSHGIMKTTHFVIQDAIQETPIHPSLSHRSEEKSYPRQPSSSTTSLANSVRKKVINGVSWLSD